MDTVFICLIESDITCVNKYVVYLPIWFPPVDLIEMILQTRSRLYLFLKAYENIPFSTSVNTTQNHLFISLLFIYLGTFIEYILSNILNRSTLC